MRGLVNDFRRPLDGTHPTLQLFIRFTSDPFANNNFADEPDAPTDGLILHDVVQADYFMSITEERSRIDVWKVGRTTGLTLGFLRRAVPARFRCDGGVGAYVQDVGAPVANPGNYGPGFRGVKR